MSDQTSSLNVELLYCDHHGWLQGWLRRKLGNSFDAADLAHDTFVRVMASRRLPQHMGDEPRALLTHIAKGLVIDHWRRQEVEAAYLETVAGLPEPEVPSPEARLLIIEALMRIDAMLASLPPRTREVFLLAQLDGLTRHGPVAMSSAVHIDTALLKEAADWAIVFQYDTPTDAERQAFECWHQQSPAHAAAWARAQSVFHTFNQVPTDIGKGTVSKLERGHDRRRTLRLLGTLLLAVPVGWLAYRQVPWRQWTADVATATGERKTLTLPDGSVLVLNTASAVNIAFSDAERRVRLVAGEILVTTHTDPSPTYRPFLVDTSLGVAHALGTRFSVRELDADTYRVAVFESAVEVRPLAGNARTLHAGEQAEFDAAGVSEPVRVESTAALWAQGMLLAKDMRLADVVAELARHRPGVLRCDPAVADLRVSGSISLADTDAGLAALASSMPLRIERRTRYWVTVGPRS